MKRYLLAAAAVAAIASPAAARDGAGYVGIEGGFLMDSDLKFDLEGTLETDTFDFDDAYDIDFNVGQDLDLIAGYDLGMFRVEAELGYKRAKFQGIQFDDDLIDDGEDVTELDFDGRMKVVSLMANGLLDLVNADTHSVYAGVGFGRARATIFGDKDSAWAYQLIAGARWAMSDNLDVGLKYRFFNTRNLRFTDEGEDLDLGTFDLTSSGKLRSHSILLSLIYNFAAAAPLPPPPPPPPPAPVAPATQTCPDGSVILATDMCPLPPPPPPPPPPPAGERG